MLFELAAVGGRAGRLWQKAAGELDHAFDWASLDPTGWHPELVERGRLGWTENAFNEHCTAAAMGQLLEVMVQANVPVDLVGMASTFVLDEVVHVELCARVAMRLGGGAPIRYDAEDLHHDFEPGLSPLQRANELVVRLCCVGETFSLPMLAGSQRAATHPLTRAVLERIVADEANHGDLGWLYLDWIGEQLDAAERRRLFLAAQDTAAHLVSRYRDPAPPVPSDALPPHFHDMGWMSPTDYRRRADEAVEAVFTRLQRVGIAG